jgi:hypothetical protein
MGVAVHSVRLTFVTVVGFWPIFSPENRFLTQCEGPPSPTFLGFQHTFFSLVLTGVKSFPYFATQAAWEYISCS